MKHFVGFFTGIMAIAVLSCILLASCEKGKSTQAQTSAPALTQEINTAEESQMPLRRPILEDIYSSSEYTVIGDPSYIATGWVKTWLEETYKEFGMDDLEAEFKSRAVYDSFSDSFQISPILYSVRASLQKPIKGAQKQLDGTYSFSVLAIAVVENDKYVLSGFVAPDKFKEDDCMPAAYEVVAMDPRYSSKLKSSPKVNLPKGFTQVDMRLVSDGRDSIGAFTRVLPGDIVASFCGKALDKDGKYTTGFVLFDLKAGKTCGYAEMGDYYPRTLKVSDGKLSIYATDNNSSDVSLFTIDSKGNVKKQKLASDKETALYSPDGSRYAYSSKGNLYIADAKDNVPTLIGKGNDTDTTDWVNYYPYAWADNSRLVYGIGGYEWSNGCGLYDALSGKDTSFKNVDPNAQPVACINGKLFIINGVMDADVEPYVIDLNDPGCPHKKVFKDRNFTIGSLFDSFAFSPDGTMIAVLKPALEKNDKNVLYVCSTEDGSILKNFEFQVSSCRPQYLDFFEDERIAIYSEKYALSPDYMYLVDIR